MNRASAIPVLIILALAGCSSGPDPVSYSVSYRNQVRLPHANEMLKAATFALQIKDKDPIRPIRCLAEESAEFQKIADDLGGIEWNQPVEILKDRSLPPLYKGKRGAQFMGSYAPADTAGAIESVTIERPDLVGIQNGIAAFLSKQHGLVAVKMDGATPTVTCSLKIPGSPINFFYKGGEIVVLTNGTSGQLAALLRFKLVDQGFAYVDSVRLKDQRIQDARLFNDTLVIYSLWTKERENPRGPVPYGLTASLVAFPPQQWYAPRGVKLVTVQWDTSLNVDWDETFTNGRRRPDWDDSVPGDPDVSDPLMGQDPAAPRNIGDVISVQRNYKPFLSASDGYLVVTRDASRTLFDGTRTESYTYCSQYNPQYQQIEICSPVYERQDNRDYVAPSGTGDYSCGGQTLAACLAQAAPKVSQYIWVKTGQNCSMVWQGRCEAYETKTYTYPVYKEDQRSEFAVYRYQDGAFHKLDAALAQLDPSTPGSPAAIKFNQLPLSVPGFVSNKDQLQFQNGRFYVVADDQLHTLLITGNTVALARTLPLNSNLNYNPAVLFTPDRLLISTGFQDFYTGTTASHVAMFDLSEPSLPVPLNSYDMPGVSSQLLLAESGILGPGTVTVGGIDESSGDTALPRRTFEKLTLFSRDNGAEQDNLLLGTEYDALAGSWFVSGDDQRIRLHAPSQKLFLPYAGRHHADQYDPTAYRLSITRVDPGHLVPEKSFEFSEDIVRTTSVDSDRALAFGNAGIHFLDRRSGDWVESVLRELFVPIATYRLNDRDFYARIDRLGTRCRLTTHRGPDDIFGDDVISQSEVPCGEWESPVAVRNHVLFGSTLTGWRISQDGALIELLDRDSVTALLEEVRDDAYCMLDATVDDSTPVEYLDDIPASIACEPYALPTNVPMSTGAANPI
ncbi:MAG: hypothetical protein V1798_01155 [Pseudomonadota bacterium]